MRASSSVREGDPTFSAIDDQRTVADLTVPEDVTILTDAGQVIVKIAELVAPEPEPEPVAEEGAETPAEGEATEGEKAEEEKTPEEKAE